MKDYPRRIVVLCVEAAEWLRAIGAWSKVVGVTCYYEQPPYEALVPCVSGFSVADVDRILQLQPDLVVTFSDVQANIAGELIRRGIPVFATNQRSIIEIHDQFMALALMVRCDVVARAAMDKFLSRIVPRRGSGRKPKIYFEEWNKPMITGIGWVNELILRAGGEDCFGDLVDARKVDQRVVTPEMVVERDPDIIVASWCGKKWDREEMLSRLPHSIKAIETKQLYEIECSHILTPGLSLAKGFDQLCSIIDGWKASVGAKES